MSPGATGATGLASVTEAVDDAGIEFIQCSKAGRKKRRSNQSPYAAKRPNTKRLASICGLPRRMGPLSRPPHVGCDHCPVHHT